MLFNIPYLTIILLFLNYHHYSKSNIQRGIFKLIIYFLFESFAENITIYCFKCFYKYFIIVCVLIP